MLSSRKRKAIPEKGHENFKMRKLKVSNKIFRSPGSPKPNNVAKIKISKLLPEGYDSMIVTANTKVEENIEGNEAVYGCVRLPIITKEDALIWLKKFERNTSTSYHSQKTWKSDDKTGLLKRRFLCNHRVGGVYSCKACIIFTIKDATEIQTNPDYYLRDYPSQVIIQFCHNHKIDLDLYVKNLHPSTELRAIFGTYFANGHSPFSALICHKCDLHSSYGPEFYDVVSNGDICPSYNWCSREFEKLYARKFIEPKDDELNEKLSEAVNRYNIRCFSECAVLAEDPFVLSVCTPLMKSVFRSGFAEDFITVRTFCTPKSVPKRQKLVLFLCHTPIGSLPFGIVLTFTEDCDVVCRGIQTLTAMLGEPSYSPKTIITDENSLISKSLTKSFSKSQIVFNEFQMLQSIWRIVRLICQDNNDEFHAVYNAFVVAINSVSEEAFKINFQQLEALAEKYPKLSNFLKYFKFRSESYVHYARPKVEFNTNVLNYTDSGTIILQDVSIKYGTFFNVLQLFDFLTRNYLNYYERKLMKIVDGDLKGFFKTNFFVPLNKIADFTCTKISDTEFLVSLNDMIFFVNAELDTCTCQVGVYGGSCVHQYIVEKTVGLVPECYTPLGEDMLDILKSILSYKDARPQKQDLENNIDDRVSSAGSSELGNMSDCSQDADNLGPIDEIYLVPSEVGDSFTEQDLSPLKLNDFGDVIEDNELLNEGDHYNRISGEIESIESVSNATASTNLLADKVPQHDRDTGKVIVYDYSDDHGEVKVIPVSSPMVLSSYGISESAVVSGIDTPVVYTYSTENEDPMQIYREVMTENDKKTAEIAEFLTNLPDTNYLNSGDPVVSSKPLMQARDVPEPEEASEVLKQFQRQIVPTGDPDLTSEGVVVMKNDELFTQYRVMENGVLSIITDTDDEYANQINTFQAASAQNFLSDSYEDANFIMMSPTDLFDNNENIDNANEIETTVEKTDPKINVLSSVIIKPSTTSLGISKTPLNINVVKHKTLRSVKEANHSRVNESSFIQNSSKSNFPTVVQQQQQQSGVGELNQTRHKSNIEKENLPVEKKSESQETDESDAMSECLDLTECDPEQLLENFEDVIEIDSDDLEELASQDLDSALVLGLDKQMSPLKGSPVMPIKKSTFLRNVFSTKQAEKQPDIGNKKSYTYKGAILKTAFSQLTDLKSKNNNPGSTEKLLGKFKELDSGVLEGFGANSIKSELKRKNTRDEGNEDCEVEISRCDYNDPYSNLHLRYGYSDSDESSLFSDSDCFGSTEFEHYSDCRTSCSEFHSELEGIDGLSDYELYELELSGSESSDENKTNIKSISKKTNISNVLSSQPKAKSYIIHLDSDLSDDDDRVVKSMSSAKISDNTIPVRKKAIRNRPQQMRVGSSNEKLTEVFKNIKAKKSLNQILGSKFKLNNEVSVARIQSAKNGATSPRLAPKSFNEDKRSFQLKAESSQQSKDADELETILTHGLGADGSSGKPHLGFKKKYIVDNEELAFLFNDPRFETIIEDSESHDDNLDEGLVSSPIEVSRHNTTAQMATPEKYLQYPLFKPKTAKKYRRLLPKPSLSQGQLVLPGVQIESSSIVRVEDEVQEAKPVRRRGRPRKSERPILIQDDKTQKKTEAQEGLRSRNSTNNVADGDKKKKGRRGRKSTKSNQFDIGDISIKTENNEIKTEFSQSPMVLERTDTIIKEAPRRRGRRGRKSLIQPLDATSSSNADDIIDNTLDFENSIDIIALHKKSPKSHGYEDAFKRFLATSNEKGTKPFSDFEDYREKSDSDPNISSRRKSKSVCKPKLRLNPFADASKLKKSVSWAEGVNVGEMIEESDNDSDGSEIISPKKAGWHKMRPKPVSIGKEEQLLESKDIPRKRGRPRKNATSPKRANARADGRKRVKSSSRTRELELIVLLERNIEIELMCQAQKKWSPRESRGRRRGYKELLENAKRIKDFKR